MPVFTLAVLRAKIWDNNQRVNQAARVPFHSMKMGEQDTDFDNSVNTLQLALERIERFSIRLPQKHLPVPRVVKQEFPNQAKLKQPTRLWGPFHIKFSKNPIKKRSGEESGTGRYGELTFFAVQLFQKQAGFTADGKAGSQTLRRLDEILLFLETLD